MAHRLRRGAVVLAECLVLRYGGVEVDHLVTIVDPVRQADPYSTVQYSTVQYSTVQYSTVLRKRNSVTVPADHEVLPGERLQHRHLLQVRVLVH